MKNSKSFGQDGIPTTVLKVLKHDISNFLVNAFNEMIDKEVFPSCFKVAKIIPLFKGGDKDSFNNYRPISLLSNVGKIFEKLISKRILKFLNRHDILDEHQFGFRNKRSTTDAIVAQIERIREALEAKEKASILLLDLKKAFDTIDHKMLFTKLDRIGIRGKMNKIIESYLTDRYQYIHIGSRSSSMKRLTTGVPQGSILGPLLFLIYINDLPKNCSNVFVSLYADDTALLSIDPVDPTVKLKDNLENLKIWFSVNRLQLNLSKSTLINFKQSIAFLDNCVMSCTCKYLGLVLDKNLTFDDHIRNVVLRSSRLCGVIYRIRTYVNRNNLLLFYECYIKPIIIYGILSYGCTSFNKLKPIFLIQKRIIRAICYMKKDESVQHKFKDLELLTVYELYCYELIKYVIKSIRKELPKNCNFFHLELSQSSMTTRGMTKTLTRPVKFDTVIMKHSLKRRSSCIYNYVRGKDILPPDLSNYNTNGINCFLKQLKRNFIIGNNELVNQVFN
ncbi:MAG: reverse transcriptase family protein [Bacteroidota bacterium]